MSARRRLGLAVAVFVALYAVVSSLFAEALGLTYDEPVYAAVGERHLGWSARLLRFDLSAFRPDQLARHWGNAGPTPVEADWHPPVGKELLALARRLPLPGLFARWRAGSVLLFALTGALLCGWLGTERGTTAGLAAALAWATLPRAVAHGSLAALDGPVAALSLVALWLGWRLLQTPTRPRALAFAAGLALAAGTKFNGVLVAPVVLLAALCWRREAVRAVLGALVVAPLLLWLLWPWLWYDGWTHVRQVLAFHGRHGYIATEYFGRVFIDPPPPWHYPLVMLAVTTPAMVWPTVVAAGERGRSRPPLAGYLALAVAVHLLPFAAPAAAKYNGLRLFLPALPPLAALSGLGLARLAAAVRRRVSALAEPRWIAPAVLALAVYLPGLVGLLQVHPYPMAYYNAGVGGAAGAWRRGLEVSYWGDPFRAAAAWLSRPDTAAAGDRVYLWPPGALAMVEMYRDAGLLRSDLRLVSGPEAVAEARWFVYQNRPSEWDELGRSLLERVPPRYVERAAGAPVLYVWERSDLERAWRGSRR